MRTTVQSFLRRLAGVFAFPAGADERFGSAAFWRKLKPVSPGKLALLAAFIAGALAGALFPRIATPLLSLFASKPQSVSEERKGVEGLVKLTAEQIAAAKIEIVAAEPGVIARRIAAPAVVAADPDRLGRVAAKVAGTVAELKKRLGDQVEKGEVVALLDSRDVADAKSDYLASLVSYELQNTLFQREKGLFEKKITAEQLFLRARSTFSEAKLRLDLARQKLAALDLSETEIASLPEQPVAELRRKEIRAPISGRVIERRVNLGQPVGGEGQEKELFALADLSVVQADLSVPAADAPLICKGQAVSLIAPGGARVEGQVAFVSPLLNPDTRSARVIASFSNADFALRPGSLLEAKIALAERRVALRIPRAALQMVNGEPSAFVRADAGFVRRKLETRAADDESVEVLSGLAPGELVAATNTFLLKAELGKGELESLD